MAAKRAAQSFTEDEVKVMNEIFKWSDRSPNAEALVRHPAYTKLRKKFHAMQGRMLGLVE